MYIELNFIILLYVLSNETGVNLKVDILKCEWDSKVNSSGITKCPYIFMAIDLYSTLRSIYYIRDNIY